MSGKNISGFKKDTLDYSELKEEIRKIDEDCLIIVEGKNDVKALRNIGIENSILPLDKRPLYMIVEKAISLGRTVMILVDLDKEGKKIYGYLYHHLTRQGVKADDRFREFLFRSTKVRKVEELDRYYFNLRKKARDILR